MFKFSYNYNTIRLTSTTWVEAQQKFPEHTKIERLGPFRSIFSSASKSIPESFKARWRHAVTNFLPCKMLIWVVTKLQHLVMNGKTFAKDAYCQR